MGSVTHLWPPSQETGRGAVCSHSAPSQLASLDLPEAKSLPLDAEHPSLLYITTYPCVFLP